MTTRLSEERLLKLLPPEAFSAEKPRGPHPLHRVDGTFASRLNGMANPPTAADLANAIDGACTRSLSEQEEQAVWTWFKECTTAELIEGHLEGAYSMRALVAAMHRVGGADAHDEARKRAINTHCEAAWIERRNRADPAAEMKVIPHRKF